MAADFDPRPWNLLAGLTVAAGCSARTISLDGDSTDSVADGETDSESESESVSESDSESDSGPECIDDFDCPYGYYCYAGECEYLPPDDGYVPYYECYSDDDCGPLELCQGNDCWPVLVPAACESPFSPQYTFEAPGPVLNLAFVDIYSHWPQELLVVDGSELHVYDSGSQIPMSYPLALGSTSVSAIVGGHFDDEWGTELVVLHDDQLTYVTGGLGNLQSSTGPSPFPLTYGLEAGNFDDQGQDDLLLWGGVTSGVLYSDFSGTGLLELFAGEVTSADARVQYFYAGFTLLRDDELVFINASGDTIGSVFLRGAAPRAQSHFDALDTPQELGTSVVNGWTLIEAFDRLSASPTLRWGIEGTVQHLRTGRFGGIDDVDDVALIIDGSVWLWIGLDCWAPVDLDGHPAVRIAWGDHDGDGDDELAVASGLTIVSIVDVE